MLTRNLCRRTVLSLFPIGIFETLYGCGSKPADAMIDTAAIEALYNEPPTLPVGGRAIFHLGHSLVGRDMPAMLAQLAGPTHHYASQLGWGASLKQHLGPSSGINGFAQENGHQQFRAAKAAVGSGDYDSLVVTEMVEIRDAIRYHDSAESLYAWATLGRASRPDLNIYLYETWHSTNDREGWATRIQRDLERHWENEIVIPAVRKAGFPIYIIPGGQALAAVVRAVQDRGGVDGAAGLADFFATASDGSQDDIHLGDFGNYVVALTHYAVLYQASPAGLSYEVRRADGDPVRPIGPMLARLMQDTVWQVVRRYKMSGAA